MLVRDLDPRKLERLSRTLHALGHPTRLGIVNRLRAGERCVQELVRDAGSTQPNISGHLALLHDAGVLKRRREDNRVYYAIANHGVERLLEQLFMIHRPPEV